MPFTDVIDDYNNGATGTITMADGNTTTYTVSSNLTAAQAGFDYGVHDNAALVLAQGTNFFNVEFAQPVTNAVMAINGASTNENYLVVVNGSTVNLQTLVDSGQVTIDSSPGHSIAVDGSINGNGTDPLTTVTVIQFNFPVTSLGAQGAALPGQSGGDVFEVGINNTTVVCFTTGTLIETDKGPTPVETLKVGMRIRTQDNGFQKLRWLGRHKVSVTKLNLNPKLRPVRFAAGALGHNLPLRDMRVSRQHRVLVRSRIAQRMFGTDEVLVPAIQLVGLPGIDVCDATLAVGYFHLLFDNHEVIFAEGAPLESLLIADQSLEVLAAGAQVELEQLFSDIATGKAPMEPARLIPRGARTKILIKRHQKNKKALVDLVEREQMVA